MRRSISRRKTIGVATNPAWRKPTLQVGSSIAADSAGIAGPMAVEVARELADQLWP